MKVFRKWHREAGKTTPQIFIQLQIETGGYSSLLPMRKVRSASLLLIFTLQDLLAQVHPVPGPFLNTLSSADKAAYGYIDELGGLNLHGLPTSVNNMLNGLSRRVQQQADGRFLTSIKDYGWDPNSGEDARQVIQRAIRDMARNPYGGVIYLPPGSIPAEFFPHARAERIDYWRRYRQNNPDAVWLIFGAPVHHLADESRPGIDRFCVFRF
ncbi:glycosyl hydrolase family 28-related protein [Klebsiella quasipneumoniae]|uniref:glycosyl hydrolase family 28-related protein n=1 Tax=Klebsiella quasipneumoniae TaxID=1463165 RepID=UPI00388EB1CB